MPTIRVLMPWGAVRVMDFEDYLKGVVVVEMYTGWPMEALKAQAIAARTYALWYVISNDGRGRWDVDTTTRFQAYVSRRHPRTSQAVDDTAGIVGTTFDTGLVRRTYYSSSCGGHTRNNWGPAWLRSTPCPCGRGVFGHRNGMCQYGARFLAARGYTAFQILDFYYKLSWGGGYGHLGPVWYERVPDNPWRGAPVPERVPPPETDPEPPPPPIPVIPPYEVGRGRFWYEFERFLRWVAVRLGFLADGIKDIPIIGPLFFPTVDTLAIVIDDISLLVHEFEPQYLAVLAFVRDITGLTLLNDLIQRAFFEWNELRYTPRAWFHRKLIRVWPDYELFVNDPARMIEGWLTDRWFGLWDIIHDATGWVYEQLVTLWPAFRGFRDNPAYWVETWLVSRRPEFGRWLYYPQGWLKDTIIDILGLGEFDWNDPWGYITWQWKRKIEARHPYYVNWIYDFGEHLLRWFVEGVW